MLHGEKINWIANTPLGINIRKINYIKPHMNKDYLEITMCLAGEVKFSYYFEEFKLNPGEYILNDCDIHYLYDGKDAICASFYINTDYFLAKYPFIKSVLFVCEGTADSENCYNTKAHKDLKSMLLALLLLLEEKHDDTSKMEKTITETSQKIVDLLVSKFDIAFWYHPDLDVSEKMFNKYRLMIQYISDNCHRNIHVSDLAKKFSLSNAYVTEVLSKYTLGFNKMLSYFRLAKGEENLFGSEMSIIDISEACNFSDPKYYYSTFKYWFKDTPDRFRRKYIRDNMKGTISTDLSIEDVKEPLNYVIHQHIKYMFL